MTSEGLEEMFKDDFADMCTEMFTLVLMGAQRKVKCAQTRERGPPSAPAKILMSIMGIKLDPKEKYSYFGIFQNTNTKKS